MATIKSRPIYEKLAIDPTGARHLLLCEDAEVPDEAFADGIAPMAAVETWTIAGDSRTIPGRVDADEHPSNQRRFRSRAQMLDRLEQRLATECMGLRLYAIGAEDFVWDVRNVGTGAGMGSREIRVTHVGSLRRRVVCVHCRTTMQGITTTIAICAGCGASLFVRDHFSRRLGGFQGVQVDAEVPGEVPAVEEAYP